jgi:indolepyruvate ferredoxin oxidoreductase beta subunit
MSDTDKVFNILLVGVGGQGIVLAGDIIAGAAVAEGYDAKKSEIHGMSQRGGPVFCHVRFGKKIYSPLIPKGGADALISLEELETLRWIEYVSPERTSVFFMDEKISPHGLAAYPETVEEDIRASAKKIVRLPKALLAAKTGNVKLLNTAVLGVVSVKTPLKKESWLSAILARVPAAMRDDNIKAFEAGRALAAEL